MVLRCEPGTHAAHDHVDGDGADVEGEDSTGDFDVFLDQVFMSRVNLVVDELEQDHHEDGQEHGAKNCTDGDGRIEFLAHENRCNPRFLAPIQLGHKNPPSERGRAFKSA